MTVPNAAPAQGQLSLEALQSTIESLREQCTLLASIPIDRIVGLFDQYSKRLLADRRTHHIDGAMFLSAWLRGDNLRKMLELNLGGRLDYLDGLVPYGRAYLAAKPQGLVAMWMAGNVGTLPLFSLVPALLTKNVCVVKLANSSADATERLLSVLAECEVGGLSGNMLLNAVSVVSFDHRDRQLGEAMSMAADVKVLWGGEAAVKGITALPRREHCSEIIFGPKYSIGLIDRKLLESNSEKIEEVVSAFARDIAIFDQRACSAPQTIFVERNSRCSLREIGEVFARHLAKLPPKRSLDAYTTMSILNARAEWALHPDRDVIVSADGANWTVCLDCQLSLKEAVQSRTIFLTEVGSWQEVIPLINHKVQSAGIAFGELNDAIAFAEAGTAAGLVRCVRPGLMNLHESPWDGKLYVNQLVRWVSLKP